MYEIQLASRLCIKALVIPLFTGPGSKLFHKLRSPLTR